MSVSLHAHDLHAAFKRECVRLHARPSHGGPYSLVRDDALLAWMPGASEVEVDERRMAALAGLPDGAGCGAVAGVLAS